MADGSPLLGNAWMPSTAPVWPSVRGQADTSYVGTGSETLAVNVPAHEAGDILIMEIATQSLESHSVPSGWTAIHTTSVFQWSIYKKATSSSSATTQNVSLADISNTGNHGAQACCVAVKDVNTSGTYIEWTAQSNSTSEMPSLTPSWDDEVPTLRLVLSSFDTGLDATNGEWYPRAPFQATHLADNSPTGLNGGAMHAGFGTCKTGGVAFGPRWLRTSLFYEGSLNPGNTRERVQIALKGAGVVPVPWTSTLPSMWVNPEWWPHGYGTTNMGWPICAGGDYNTNGNAFGRTTGNAPTESSVGGLSTWRQTQSCIRDNNWTSPINDFTDFLAFQWVSSDEDTDPVMMGSNTTTSYALWMDSTDGTVNVGYSDIGTPLMTSLSKFAAGDIIVVGVTSNSSGDMELSINGFVEDSVLGSSYTAYTASIVDMGGQFSAHSIDWHLGEWVQFRGQLSAADYDYWESYLVDKWQPDKKFAPDDISGLLTWHDFSDTSTITAQSGDANAVDWVDDKSGSASDFDYTSIGTFHPGTGERTVNELNALECVINEDDFRFILDTSAALDTTPGSQTPFVAFVAFQADSLHAGTLLYGKTDVTKRWVLGLEADGGARIDLHGNKVESTAGGTYAAGTPTVGMRASNFSGFPTDGTSTNRSQTCFGGGTCWAHGSTSGGAATTLTMGKGRNNNDRYDGLIGEVIFYQKSDMSLLEVNRVGAYLADKWGAEWDEITAWSNYT